jgi:ribonuclease-3
VIAESGPDHKKTFEVNVKIDEEKTGRGTGKNKKTAEQSAAKELCRKLGVKINEAL